MKTKDRLLIINRRRVFRTAWKLRKCPRYGWSRSWSEPATEAIREANYKSMSFIADRLTAYYTNNLYNGD